MSMLGPILFTLYVNDIAMTLNIKPIIFLDDTNILCLDAGINNLKILIKEELRKL